MRPLFLYAPGLKRYETEYLSSKSGWKAVSVTGSHCAFNCKHCGRRILYGMEDASTEEKLTKILESTVSEGHKGIVLSGGSTIRGEVPIWKFTSVLKKYKDKLTYIAHTGVVKSQEIANRFAEAGIKIALLDMVGDDDTIRDILGQPFTVDEYLNSFKYLKNAGILVVPHIIVGLSEKGVESELNALELLKGVKPDAVIVVGLMPLSISFPKQAKVEDMIKVLKKARDEYSVPVMLGCARPRGGEYIKVERFAVDYDIDGIAFPEEDTIEYAKDKRQLIFNNSCCAHVVFDILGVV
ncbi:MAG: radical SAM protein [Sulfolobus sp.]